MKLVVSLTTRALSLFVWTYGSCKRHTTATDTTMAILKRRMFMSKQTATYTTCWNIVNTLYTSLDGTASLHIDNWSVGVGVGSAVEWEWCYQAVLWMQSGTSFLRLVSQDLSIQSCSCAPCYTMSCYMISILLQSITEYWSPVAINYTECITTCQHKIRFGYWMLNLLLCSTTAVIFSGR